ncbi:TRAP transporter large permease [Thauera sp. SDU_THAU2]|uniref:TRAP transporter large permease n=1 Tax=Thauera sp. SDU_THAU2 TaxID=3136633 RepID=UPI00311E9BBC
MAAIIATSLLVLFSLFALSFHVASALGLTAALTGALHIGDISGFFGQIPWNSFSNSGMIVVPLFILMGELLLRSGVTEELYDILSKWMGRVPGGLLHSNVLACGLFSSICGSSVATTSTIGAVALPEMRRHGYDEKLAVGSISAGGTLGILIPPSVIMIIYAIMAEVSIAQLYMAGVVPGLLMMAAFMLVILAVALIAPDKAPRLARKVSWSARLRGLAAVLPVIVLMGLVLGTIYAGVATPTEAAAFGSVGAFLLAALKGRVNRAMLREVFLATASTTSMVLLVVACAFVLQFVLSLGGVPAAISNWIAGLGLSQLQLILIIALIFIVLGMFMESMAMIVCTLPILLPILKAAGVDLVWFGVLAVILVELSLITPPVGMNLFVMQGLRTRMDGVRVGPMTEVFAASLPFVLAMLAVLGLVIAYPGIAMGLVESMKQ